MAGMSRVLFFQMFLQNVKDDRLASGVSVNWKYP
jgi:hypothetical protein